MARINIIMMSLMLVIGAVHFSEGQQSRELGYTILKLHTLKTETEICKMKFKNAGRFQQKTHNTSLSFGLVPNCSNCERLTVSATRSPFYFIDTNRFCFEDLKQHLVRIHKVVKHFALPFAAVYAFEMTKSNTDIKDCVGKVQLELWTLLGVLEMQVSPASIALHTSASIEKLKLKARKYLEQLPENTNIRLNEDDVMKKVSSTLIKEIFLAAVVLQKNRIEIQNMITSNNVY